MRDIRLGAGRLTEKPQRGFPPLKVTASIILALTLLLAGASGVFGNLTQ